MGRLIRVGVFLAVIVGTVLIIHAWEGGGEPEDSTPPEDLLASAERAPLPGDEPAEEVGTPADEEPAPAVQDTPEEEAPIAERKPTVDAKETPPAPKPESKPEPKREPPPAPKPETKRESKPEPKREPPPAPKPETKPEPVVEEKVPEPVPKVTLKSSAEKPESDKEAEPSIDDELASLRKRIGAITGKDVEAEAKTKAEAAPEKEPSPEKPKDPSVEEIRKSLLGSLEEEKTEPVPEEEAREPEADVTPPAQEPPPAKEPSPAERVPARRESPVSIQTEDRELRRAADLYASGGYEELVALDPRPPESGDDDYVRRLEAYYKIREYQGCALMERGEFGAAAQHFRQIVESRPKEAVARYNLLLSLYQMGGYRDVVDYAYPDVQKAKSMIPTNRLRDILIKSDYYQAMSFFFLCEKESFARRLPDCRKADRSLRNFLAKYGEQLAQGEYARYVESIRYHKGLLDGEPGDGQ